MVMLYSIQVNNKNITALPYYKNTHFPGVSTFLASLFSFFVDFRFYDLTLVLACRAGETYFSEEKIYISKFMYNFDVGKMYCKNSNLGCVPAV